ncbi:MAG: trans-2-enoyl-CoA reductase family protein [Puniceicoccales bacterium]|jgi:enoyl-[acyl-carrier protein] reductase/trans-2-enoyl-CoA reductase (NAD+)|nr:trans-2-enoyl-CoA reductase family protein [Puniceicoccales bacterium]
MVIKPKIRGFVCVTSHPEGCREHVREQIAYVKKQGHISGMPKKFLIIGSSTGYGLSSRVVATVGGQADTIGVFFERPEEDDRPASAGFYNARTLDEYAQQAGLVSESINGDAFSDTCKQRTIELIREKFGKVDAVVYSLASPRRIDPKTGETYRSLLKPIGQPFRGKTVNTDKKEVHEITIEPANEQEIYETIKVMGGEDWKLWMDALKSADVLSDGIQAWAYSYVGPEITWPIYTHGTIGKAKEDLERVSQVITDHLSDLHGKAFIVVNKAVVTQASSAIPVVPLYMAILFKVMKQKVLHENCIQQMDRLFRERLCGEKQMLHDAKGRIRMDDWEMRLDVQDEVKRIWPEITTENLEELSDFAGYQRDFLRLFGFGFDSVNYDADISLSI